MLTVFAVDPVLLAVGQDVKYFFFAKHIRFCSQNYLFGLRDCNTGITECLPTVKAGLVDNKSDFDKMHQDLARTEKRLANVGSRIAVPAILCYCCFITLFLSLAFLIMTIWAIGIEDYGQKIAATAIKFGWITGIVNAIILAYSIWHHRH